MALERAQSGHLCRAIRPQPTHRIGLREQVVVIGIHRCLHAQMSHLCALLLGAVGEVFDRGTVVGPRKVCLQAFNEPDKTIDRRVAVGVRMELETSLPKHFCIGA